MSFYFLLQRRKQAQRCYVTCPEVYSQEGLELDPAGHLTSELAAPNCFAILFYQLIAHHFLMWGFSSWAPQKPGDL